MSDSGFSYAELPQWWFAIDLLVGILAFGGMVVVTPFVLDLHPIMYTDVFPDGGGNGALLFGSAPSDGSTLFPMPEHPGGRVRMSYCLSLLSSCLVGMYGFGAGLWSVGCYRINMIEFIETHRSKGVD